MSFGFPRTYWNCCSALLKIGTLASFDYEAGLRESFGGLIVIQGTALRDDDAVLPNRPRDVVFIHDEENDDELFNIRLDFRPCIQFCVVQPEIGGPSASGVSYLDKTTDTSYSYRPDTSPGSNNYPARPPCGDTEIFTTLVGMRWESKTNPTTDYFEITAVTPE